jgi:glyoxylase-like metal-dependent hydrolase (beta-lactamase superfamily II)
MHEPEVISFFDEATFTASHVVADRDTGRCAVIDTVLDYNPNSSTTSHASADRLIAEVRSRGLQVEWILETHAHADHLTAAPYVREQLGGRLAIGCNITRVQEVFGRFFNLGPEFRRDGSQFDLLLEDGQTFKVGNIEARAIYTPGHTPACMIYVIGDACFVGDTLFMPDYGTARCDFPGGDAASLYRSVRKIFSLPDETRMFLCHDYPPEGRKRYIWETTVGEQRRSNIHIHEGITEQAFVAMRKERDATLELPRLILQSVQVNIRAGHLPPAEDNGRVYLKLPVNAFKE